MLMFMLSEGEKMRKKKIKIIGDIEVGGERGRVMDRGGQSVSMTSTDYKDPAKVVKRLKESDKHTRLKVNQELFTTDENQS